MRPIPKKVREEINSDPFYKACCLCGSSGIQIHHNLIHSGRQSDDIKTMLPLCVDCHDMARKSCTKERLDLVMLKRMNSEEITAISKAVNYHQRLKYLTKKYDKN